MDNKEVAEILNYVLGRSKERAHTRMWNKGITLYPDIQKEREALEKALEAIEKTDGYIQLKVVGSCS